MSVIAFMKQLYYVYTSTFLWASMGQPSLFDSVNSHKSEASMVCTAGGQHDSVWPTSVV